MSQVNSTKKLLSASAIMASGTLISRALGMLRVMLIAFIIGNGTRQADILDIANMVPNALYILFAGGALNTVLVPQIVRAIKHDDDGGEAFTNRIITAFVLIVAAVAALATLCAPLITRLYSSSAWREPSLAEQYASMVALTYLTLPQIFFYGLFFLLAQVLNAKEKYGPMMWAPIANNVVSLLVLSIYLIIWGNGGDKSAAFTTQQILLLGVGSTLGIVVQALILLPLLRRVGFKLRPRFDLRGAGLGHTFSLAKWSLGFVAVNQLALIVVNRLATTATAGGAGAGVNVYSNAHLLWILPHSLVTTSLATAMLSSASKLAADDDKVGVAEEMTKTTRLALLFLVPAAAGFLALALPISDLLLGYGQGAADASWVGWTLVMFAIGLVPFTVQFVCLRTYYALEDTRTPFLLQVGIASANALLAILLVNRVGDPAWVAPMLALAYSIAYFVGVLVSWQFLREKLPALDGSVITRHIIRLGLGAGVGGAAAYFLSRWLTGTLGATVLSNLLAVTLGGTLVLTGTVVVGKLLRVRELRRLSELVRTRLRRGSTAPVKEVAPAQETAPQESTPPPDASPAEEPASEAEADERAAGAEPVVDEDGRGAPQTLAAPSDPVMVESAPGQADEPTWFGPDELPPEPEEQPPGVSALAGNPGQDEAAPTGTADEPDVEEHTAQVSTPAQLGEVGMTLSGGRYQLEKRVVARSASETWLAVDTNLSRDVVVHLFPSDSPAAAQLQAAAKRGAATSDARFLQVLDYNRFSESSLNGVYVAIEHCPGHSLEELYAKEPLTTAESSYVAREVAEALTPLHAQGIYHQHLDPQHILITSDGSVRITGLGIATLLETPAEEQPWALQEAGDIRALAAILRATQTGEWSPDESPEADGYDLTPVWRAAFAGELTTMKELAALLPEADSVHGLESKISLAARTAVDSHPAEDEQASPEEEHSEHAEHPERTIGPGHVAAQPRWLLRILAVSSLVTLIVALLTVALQHGEEARVEPAPRTPASETPTNPAPEGSFKVVAVKDFDPKKDGGNDEEYPELAANAVDGNPETTWTTRTYLNRPNMGGQKPGVGLVLDLGEDREVAGVEVTFLGEGPTDVALFSPKGELSYTTIRDWTELVDARPAPVGTTRIALERPTKLRYLLVYVSKLPPKGEKFQAEISEIVVRSE